MSKHVDFLYHDEDAVDDDLRQLLASEADRRTRVLSQINKTADALDDCYAWMKWCDRCSLILCGQDVPAMNRRVEIMPLPDGTLSFLHQDQDEAIRIEPWPFKSQRVTIDLEERMLSQLQFADDAELGNALMDCEPECRLIVLCG